MPIFWNSMSNLLKTLQEAGLAEKEARVYLAMLQLEGASTPWDISRQSGINRATVYVVLESLKKKGLAGTSPSADKKARYFPSSPDSLLHSVAGRVKREADVKENLEQILPELKALHKDTRHRPKVRVYEGLEGAKEVFRMALDKGVTHLETCADAGKMFGFFKDEFIKLNNERVKKGIKMRAINPGSKVNIQLKIHEKKGKSKNDQISLIPENKFRFPVNIAMCGDKVLAISMRGEFGISIENKEITESVRNIFNLAWREAQRLDKKILKRNSKNKTIS